MEKISANQAAMARFWHWLQGDLFQVVQAKDSLHLSVINRCEPSAIASYPLVHWHWPWQNKGWKTSFHYNLVVFRVYVYLPEGITYLNSWVTTWWKIFSTPNLNRHYSLVQVAKRLNAMSTTQWATNIYKNIGRTPGNHVDVLNDSPMVGEPHLDSSGYIWYPLVI